MSQPISFDYYGSAVYATTASNPMTACTWSASTSMSTTGAPYVAVTCDFGGSSGTSQAIATIPWNSTKPVAIKGSGSGVDLSGTVTAAWVGGTAVITFSGSIVQPDVVSLGCAQGLLAAVCVANVPASAAASAG